MQPAFATVPVCSDSTIPPNVARFSQEQFLTTFGADDTLRALIRFYFKMKQKAKRETLIWGSVGVAEAVVIDQMLAKGFGTDALSGSFVGIILNLLAYVSAYVIISNSFKWLHFSRKRLTKKIIAFQSDKNLPRAVYRNGVFKQLLEVEKHARNEGLH